MGILDWFRSPSPSAFPPRPGIDASVAASITARSSAEADRAVTAAVGAMVPDNGPGLMVVPGRVKKDPRAERARFYARRVGFVRRSYRFLAFQGARPPLTLERSVNGGVDWERVPIEQDRWGNDVVATIRGPNGTSAEIIRPALYLDGTVGEFMFIDVTRDGQTPAFIVRDVAGCELKKRGRDKYYVVRDQEGAKLSDEGAAIEVSADRVFRSWQPDEEWPLMATSSLMGVVDDLDTYWGHLRQVRRESNSRLAMNNILWTPTEAHRETVTPPGSSSPVSKLQLSFAKAAAAAANDVDDVEIASVAPFLIDTPKEYGEPKIITIPSLEGQLLTYLQDSRSICAASMPLSSSSILDAMESQNHWGDWLADEQDLQVIGEALRRVLDTITTVVLRPTLAYGARTGAWQPAEVRRKGDDGADIVEPGPSDPAMYRVGYDEEAIRRRLDLSDKAQWASERGLIHDDAALGYMHFNPNDRPDDLQFAAMVQRRAAMAEAMKQPQPGVTVGVVPGELSPSQQRSIGPAPSQQTPTPPAAMPAGGPVPNGGTPPEPEAAKAAAVAVIDDRWLLK